MNLVREYVCERRIAIVVLHDLTFAARWADSIIVMANKKIGMRRSTGWGNYIAYVRILYGVAARVERCTRGLPQVSVDGRMK
jgi:iron complex transport system ATP-binding protein